MPENAQLTKLVHSFAKAVLTHDAAHPTHDAYGIGVALDDMDRLGLPEGFELFPGLRLHADGGRPGAFRLLCKQE